MGRHSVDRRGFLGGATASGLLAATGPSSVLAQARPTRYAVKITSNQGVENAPLQQLVVERGYFTDLSLNTEVVESRVVDGPMQALLADQADICMISAFVGWLPAIAQGKELRMVGAAMVLPALAVYSGRDDIRGVKDLPGRTVAIGPPNGLQHVVLLALLRKKGVDPSAIKFVNAGGSAPAFEAVASGKADAGVGGIAGMSNPGAAHVLEDGRLWRELPEYTYQPAYASVRALRENPEGLARCLAAYSRLFRYLSGPGSELNYVAARQKAGGNAAEGEAVWNFIQQARPYPRDMILSPQRVAYLQKLNVELGLQSQVLPFDQVADMGSAERAKKLVA